MGWGKSLVFEPLQHFQGQRRLSFHALSFPARKPAAARNCYSFCYLLDAVALARLHTQKVYCNFENPYKKGRPRGTAL